MPLPVLLLIQLACPPSESSSTDPKKAPLSLQQAERRALDPTATELPPLPDRALLGKRDRLPDEAPPAPSPPDSPEQYLSLDWASRRAAKPGGATLPATQAEEQVWWAERYRKEAALYRESGHHEAARARLEDALDHFAHPVLYLEYADALVDVGAPADAAEAYRIAAELGLGSHEQAWRARAAALCAAGDPQGAWLAAGTAFLEGAGPLDELVASGCLDSVEDAAERTAALEQAKRGLVPPGRLRTEAADIDLCSGVTAIDSDILRDGEVLLHAEDAVAWWLDVLHPGAERIACEAPTR